MRSAEVSSLIHRPLEEVFAFLTEVDTARRWNPNLEDFEGDTGPARVGSKWVEVERSWGSTSRIEHEVLEVESKRRVVIMVTGGAFSGKHTMSLSPEDGNTRVSSALEYDVSGPLRLFGPMLNPMTKRYMRKHLSWFKEACEAEATRD